MMIFRRRDSRTAVNISDECEQNAEIVVRILTHELKDIHLFTKLNKFVVLN